MSRIPVSYICFYILLFSGHLGASTTLSSAAFASLSSPSSAASLSSALQSYRPKLYSLTVGPLHAASTGYATSLSSAYSFSVLCSLYIFNVIVINISLTDLIYNCAKTTCNKFLNQSNESHLEKLP